MRTLGDVAAHDPEATALRGLIGVLSAKLELCSRSALLEYEARADGLEALAELHAELAAQEREQVDALRNALAAQVHRAPVAPPADVRELRLVPRVLAS